ncbi:hypothetical protein HETIRDRAFT_164437 [Heterobasidion irregulare TC 32-1]|uniref:Uncharacterized protein n=1 Tax=Heterobasidion irregulare (strain TC 32-1) TaxID=747525 RepID=W4JPC7_HETIT|nr:uncharacterized protein HETIRDRAFT_164437 [Heterobasidion irregulare TC 32-1]ETW75422.1 hypothetical protein HETIRDRAFT_164437 [Heterobasidion irregulare TC 32-1]
MGQLLVRKRLWMPSMLRALLSTFSSSPWVHRQHTPYWLQRLHHDTAPINNCQNQGIN